MVTEDGQTDDKSPGNLTCAYLVPIGQKKHTWEIVPKIYLGFLPEFLTLPSKKVRLSKAYHTYLERRLALKIELKKKYMVDHENVKNKS